MKPDKISIIMPVYNEAKHLRHFLAHLRLSENEELIIVDGGSSDETLSVAEEFTGKVFQAGTGRAGVMNFGAEKAEGNILLFLHADCALPEGAFKEIREALDNPMIAAGAFYLCINHKGLCFRIIESVANLRSRVTKLLYGDQGMFLRKKTFDKVGGFADLPLMEDIEISKRLKKEGSIIFIHPPVMASPRRWLEEGVLYTTVRDWVIAFSYTFLKVAPERLIRYYKAVR